jgi:hypothetical protein
MIMNEENNFDFTKVINDPVSIPETPSQTESYSYA